MTYSETIIKRLTELCDNRKITIKNRKSDER